MSPSQKQRCWIGFSLAASLVCLAFAINVLSPWSAFAQEATAETNIKVSADVASVEADADSVEPEPFEPPPEPVFESFAELDKDWKRITKPKSGEKVWVNAKKKQVVVEGTICVTRGYLEMFACITDTKEHESVVAVDSRAQTLHFALLAVGAKPGSPARWSRSGEYSPAKGQTIEVQVEWMKDGKPVRARAQDLIRDLKTKKSMAHEFVFGGSSTWTDPETKRTIYRADGGEVICVSNFPVAMMDIPIESSEANGDLSFEAFTENIPVRRTPIRLYLIPKKDAKEKAVESGKGSPPDIREASPLRSLE